MTDRPSPTDPAFQALADESRVAVSARMLREDEPLQANQRADIVQRVGIFMTEHRLSVADAAQELGLSHQDVSLLLDVGTPPASKDRQLARLHNWMELTARRLGILSRRRFVETSVAKEILIVARTAAETMGIAVVYGPARIGKSFTLEAIVGEAAYGSPVLARVEETMRGPLPLLRSLCGAFGLKTGGTAYDVMRRLVGRLRGTKRLIIIDEADRLRPNALETIRDVHDLTGCPVLLAGKPAIYERMGFRALGDFNEVTDQLAGRVVMVRDLTERTRTGSNPPPLFSLEDIRALIHQTSLKLVVTPDGEKWLQDRASTLGMGGLQRALSTLYLAAKVAFAKGEPAITARHLASVEHLTMGHEDAALAAARVAQASGIRRVV
jgi:DNA transposition AAA+ family ATPase